MTFNLVKYEFRSTIRMMGILWIALPVLAVLMGLFDKLYAGDGLGEYPVVVNLIHSVTSFLYFAIFVALITMTVMIIILRFYKGLLRDEGYLMHTLPVKTWQLITAKGVVAVCVSVISMAVAVLSILLLSLFDGWVYTGEFMHYAAEMMKERPLIAVIGLECIFLGISWLMAVIYKVYASMSIGQLAAKHKIALSVVAHIGISIAGIMILTFAGNALNTLIGRFDGMVDSIETWISGISTDGTIVLSLLIVILFELVKVAVFHVVSEQLLRRKLNLE
ncbi:MAG: hypothetical protein IJ443_05980 [Firmicutes bacterium]|nr:hypothetical protein [Bacillota bacterium]